MNETTPQGPAAPGGPSGQHAPFGSGFFSWLRGLGIVRGGDRWFAGVAGGLAAKAGIDPLIVRGVFVVLAVLGGPGILIYLAGWLLLPDANGRIHLEDVFRGRGDTAATVIVVAVCAVILLPILFGTVLPALMPWNWGFWGGIGIPSWVGVTAQVLVWIAVCVGIALLIARVALSHGRSVSERQRNADASQGTQQPGQAGQPQEQQWTQQHGAQAQGTQAGQPQAYEAPTASAFVSWSAATTESPAAATAPTAGTAATGDPGASGGPGPTGPTGPAFGAQPGTQTGAPAGTQAGPTEWTRDFSAQANAWGQNVGARATSWSAEVGKQADEWSARYAEHHDAHRIGAAHTVLSLAFALLAAGIAGLWAFERGGTNMHLIIAALLAGVSVLAVSVIIAGVRGRHTGWIGFLTTCGVIALICTSVLPWGSRIQPFGVMHIGPESPGAVLIAGSSRVDLTSLDREDMPAEIVVWQLAGNATVTLPQRAPVTVRTRVLAGNVADTRGGNPRTNMAGPLLGSTVHYPGDERLPESTVTIYLGGGNLRVLDGNRQAERAMTDSPSRTVALSGTRALEIAR